MPTIEVNAAHQAHIQSRLTELGLETDVCPGHAILHTVYTIPIGEDRLPLKDTPCRTTGLAITPISESGDRIIAHVNEASRLSTDDIIVRQNEELYGVSQTIDWFTSPTEGDWRPITEEDVTIYPHPSQNQLWEMAHQGSTRVCKPQSLCTLWQQDITPSDREATADHHPIPGDKYGILALTTKFLTETHAPDQVVVILETLIALDTSTYVEQVDSLNGLESLMQLQSQSIMFQHFAQPTEQEV